MPDLAKLLEQILLTLDAHQVTNIFLLLIMGIFMISLILAIFGKVSVFTRNTSGLLTSLGILGTFIGIVIGLLDFNPKQIDESIELLLNGLKTAFITSLAGMAGAIMFKLIGSTKLFKANRTTTEIIDVEPRDILNAIQKQDKSLSSINRYLDELLKAIAGDNHSSLVNQVKLLRGDINDNHKKQQAVLNDFSKTLWSNLKEFSEMLSKSATEQVIEALKEVIIDFNNNLTEQFGDNFKALDASVKKLVDWQESYRIQLEAMDRQYSQSVQAILDIEKSVSHINEKSKEIPATMASLKNVLEINQHQINELENHLTAFKEVKEKAVEAFPEIQEHIDKIIGDIALSSQKASDGYNLLLKNTEGVQQTFIASIEMIQNRLEKSVSELVEKQIHEMDKSFVSLEGGVSQSVELIGQSINEQQAIMDGTIKKASDGYNLLLKSTESVQNTFVESIETIQNRLEKSVSELIKKQMDEMNKSYVSLEKEVTKSVDLTGQAVNKQLEMIDETMGQEVNRVMTEMGTALARISGEFTDDYQKLVNAMSHITRMK